MLPPAHALLLPVLEVASGPEHALLPPPPPEPDDAALEAVPVAVVEETAVVEEAAADVSASSLQAAPTKSDANPASIKRVEITMREVRPTKGLGK